MSQQINLYDPALLRKRDLLTAGNLAITATLLAIAIGAWGAAVRAQIAELEGESLSVSSLVKGLQDQAVAIGKQVAAIKADPKLELELALARIRLAWRGEVVVALKKGIGSESVGFAEYLRGLARQTPSGLWLTRFEVGEGGAGMEIRGRMLDPVLLPEYIRRLNGEKAFKGRAFAALKISEGRVAQPAAAPAAVSSPVAPTRAPYHEFVLIPTAAAFGAPSQKADEAPAAPQLQDLLPADKGRAPGGVASVGMEGRR